MSMFDRISEPVEVEDIIMVFPSRIEVQAADIWIVRSCPDGNPPCPRTDSIMVSAGLYARSTTRGRWCLFGPDVDYIPDEFENEEDIENRELFSLKDVLDPLARIRGQYDNIRITVNPHGKDVLRDYFLRLCPLCNNETWNPEEECHDDMFIGLVTTNGTVMDQACPVCMGYEFAEEDMGYVEELGELKHKVCDETNPRKYEKGKKKFLDLVRERYTLQNKRKREMGLELWNLDDRVRRYRRGWIEGKEAPANSSTEEEDEGEGGVDEDSVEDEEEDDDDDDDDDD
ncbi:hypothetical protein N7533_005335 [Penicillium manginii]|uniref:uncharacterized protein n=1 Tax=Penicillium manginii TaxID=203109 RepID=UPI002547C224|nr:uncharacterized protein N7533_005335 [Penicillium manginii]KAJ5755792.1 hypothetical protein N7533_005335 [Penicillium manginii]